MCNKRSSDFGFALAPVTYYPRPVPKGATSHKLPLGRGDTLVLLQVYPPPPPPILPPTPTTQHTCRRQHNTFA
jgi:hypothetical protein